MMVKKYNKLIKILTSVILIVLMFNFFTPTIIYATNNLEVTESEKADRKNPKFSETAGMDILNDGKTRISNEGEEKEEITSGSGLVEFIPDVILSIASMFSIAETFLMEVFFADSTTDRGREAIDKKAEIYSADAEKYKDNFKIEKVFFGDSNQLDANFFSRNDGEGGNSLNSKIKENVARWYMIMSGVALIFLLAALIYVAINMILVNAGVKTLKHEITMKKALTNIVVAIIMIFLLPIFLALISYMAEWFVDILNKLRFKYWEALANTEGGATLDFESKIQDMFYNSDKYNMSPILIKLSYILLVLVQWRFILVYFKRFFTIAFLTIISPLITITYPIDKLKDNKSQVISRFYREYFFAMTLMPLHGLMYLIFMTGASEIAAASPTFGLLILLMFGRIEKVVKGIFDSRDLMVIRSSEEYKKRI